MYSIALIKLDISNLIIKNSNVVYDNNTLIILWFSKLVASDQHGLVMSWFPDLCAICVSVIKTKVG